MKSQPVDMTVLMHGPAFAPGYTLCVRQCPFGLYRVQLCSADLDEPDADRQLGLGPILRIIETYRIEVSIDVAALLLIAEDPLALADSYGRPWNREGIRIRLDSAVQ